MTQKQEGQYHWSIRIVFAVEISLIFRKNKVFQFIKKVINRILKIIVQFLYYQVLGRYLKSLSLIQYLSVLRKTNYFPQINQVSDHLTHVNINCYQLFIVFIYKDLNHNPSLEVCANFLDISKRFDRVWHEGVLYKLETVGISGDLLNLFQNFLRK